MNHSVPTSVMQLGKGFSTYGSVTVSTKTTKKEVQEAQTTVWVGRNV